MGAFAVSFRFPCGFYEASLDEDGVDGPEWPPHPFRVVAGLTAGASRLDNPHRDLAMGAITALCSSPPPVVYTPQNVIFRPGVMRYVPVNPVDPLPSAAGKISELLTKLKPRAAQPAVCLASPNDQVVMVWDDLNNAETIAKALDGATRGVPYLGRPTSPVVMSVAALDCVDLDGLVCWRPAVGTHVSAWLRIPDQSTVDALERRRVEYLRTGCKQLFVLARKIAYVREGSGAAALAKELDPNVVVVSVGGRQRGLGMLDTISRVSNALSLVNPLPVLYTVGKYADGHLLGLLVDGRSLGVDAIKKLEEPNCKVGEVSVSQVPIRDAIASVRQGASRLYGTSRLWTTLTPIRLQKNDLMGSANELVSQFTHGMRRRATVGHQLQLHSSSRLGVLDLPITLPYGRPLAHMTVVFEQAITGPLVVPKQAPGHGAMWPLNDEGVSL